MDWDVGLGREESDNFDLRGPGRLPLGLGAVGVDVDAVGIGPEAVTKISRWSEGGVEIMVVSPDGRHIGHFFASAEFSGTSTTSLGPREVSH